MKKNVYIFVTLLFSQTIFAQTKTWNGSVNTDWFTAANWTESNGAVSGVPTATDNVVINIITNAPIISSSNAVANSITISTVAGNLLTVSNGATLTVSKSSGNSISVATGTLVNRGTIFAVNTNPTFVSNESALRVFSSGVVNNFGTFNLDGGLNIAMYISGAIFNNKTGGDILGSGVNLIRLATPNTTFINELGATISGTGTSSSIFLNPGTMSNSGTIDVTGQVEIYGNTTNPSSFTNNSCGIVKVNGAFFNQSNVTTTNEGLLQLSGSLNNNGSFTNRGALVASAYPTYTNRRLQINNNAANNAIFTISTSAGSTTINGIFFDQASTQSAGTYASNIFTPINMSGGVYTLYANITQNSCNYTVPFSYTRTRSRWYVKTVSSGAGDGSSWANASSDIQGIINGSLENDSIWIAAGVYKPQADASGNTSPTNARQKVFYMKSGIKIFGGFAGTETSLNQRDFKTNKTIFSGDIDNNDTNTDGNNIAESSTDIQGDNVYQLLVIANCNKTTRVDGIIFTSAKSNSITSPAQTINGSNITPDLGSAIHILASYPTIQNCVFSGNYGGFFGNVYQNNLSSPYIDTVKVLSSVFVGNYAQYGGGLFIRRGHHYSNNLVMINNTSEYGGAVIVQNNMGASGTIDFINATFVNNYSTYGKSLKLDGGMVKFVNTIVHNAVPYSGGNISKSGGTLTSSFSILQNSLTSAVWNNNYGADGGNNLDADPLFLNIADIDGADNKFFTSDDGLSLSLCPTPSPGINAGTNANVPTTDVTSSPRIFANTTDIGAYELQQYAVGSNINLTANISGTAIHASSNTIVATNTIQSGANVKYLANNSISLNPQNGGGFTVNSGAVFEAKIMPLAGCN
jgi:hypothetical protein